MPGGPAAPGGRKLSVFERVTHVRLTERYAKWGRQLSTVMVLVGALAIWEILAAVKVFPTVA
ncbi:MAG: hypothetical protein ACYCV5_06845, partial [Acidimicrobiales bacterium]